MRTSLKSALIPLVDSAKTAGIVSLPGAMAGLVIGGADLLGAVRLQMVVPYALLGSVSIAAISARPLSHRSFSNARHQLRGWLYED